MNIEIKPIKTPPEPVKLPEIKFLIPDCCREGWESCKHVVKKVKKKKKNIAL